MKALLHTPYLKQILLGMVVGTLVLGPFQPLIAQADTPDTAGGAAYYGDTNASGSATPASQGFGANSTTNTSAASSAGNTAQGAAPPATSPTICSIGVAECLTSIMYVFTVGIGSTFAYVAAQFFNLAVNLSLNGPIYALTFISTGWTTARDLANMAFLFILIYIAFTIMLEADTHGTMSLLAGVIVIALLVNFSFFFTRIVIDAGNILSIQFYNSITAPSIASTAASGGVTGTVASATSGITNAATGVSGANTKDLTASIMGMLNLQGLFNNSSFQNFTATQGFMVQFITLSFLYIAAAMMLWGLTVIFVTTGVKFLVRIVVLWFLIIASPLAFVARAMPPGKLRGYFDTWRDLLVSTAFYPVAFMFIFLILVNFCNQMSTSGEGNLINNLFTHLTSNQANTGIISIALAIANAAISLGFVIAILYMGMKASDKISVVGADFAKSAGGWAGGKYISTFGSAGRNTLGWTGNRVERSSVLRDAAAKGGFVGTFAKGIRLAGNKAATSSYDARGIGGLGKEFGTAQKGGYKKQVEEKVKRLEKNAKDLEPSDSDKAQARAKAEKEAPYQKNKTEHDTAKNESERVSARIKEIDHQTATNSTMSSAEKARLIEEKRDLRGELKAQTAIVNKASNAMKNRIKQISGEGINKKEYANYLERRRLGNFGIVTRSAREAADKIRHEKNNKDKLVDAAKAIAKEDKEHEEAEHPSETRAPAAPSTPTAATPSVPPAGGAAH